MEAGRCCFHRFERGKAKSEDIKERKAAGVTAGDKKCVKGKGQIVAAFVVRGNDWS